MMAEYYGPCLPLGTEIVIADYFSNPADPASTEDCLQESVVDTTLTNDTSIMEEEGDGDRPFFQEIVVLQPRSKTTVVMSSDEEKFFNADCCSKKCWKKFPQEEMLTSRWNCLEMNYNCDQHVNHLNIALRGVLNSISRTGEKTMQKEHAPKDRQSTFTEYQFKGVIVCRKTFQFVFGTGEKKLKNEKIRLATVGMQEEVHKNVKNTVRSLDAKVREKAITFIRNFAMQHALVLPGRMPTFRLNPDLLLLPCTMNKSYVYREYEKEILLSEEKHVSFSTWYVLWSTYCKNIVIQKPKNDLCAVCQSNIISISELNGLPEDEKERRLLESLEHLQKVKAERLDYNKTIEESAADILRKFPSGIPSCLQPCSLNVKIHLSFDFAQQVGIPFSSQQPGPIYFLSQFKIGLFGIAVEPMRKFYLFIIPESCSTGKGCNTVVSLLHYFFTQFDFSAKTLDCHADNCCAQNKNNIVMKYLQWRVKKGFHQSVSINFLPVGHTKFHPDIFFGLFKRNFRNSDCYSVNDIVNIAISACPEKKSIIPIVVGNEEGDVYVNTYDWQKYFLQTRNITQILSYQHFRFSESAVFLKQSLNSDEVNQTLLPNDFNVDDFPYIVPPSTLDYARRKYRVFQNNLSLLF